MKKCGSDLCGILIPEKRKYCSLSCRTRTTNLLYKKYEDISIKRKEKSREKYEQKTCLVCSSAISYEKRRSSFCSRNCSATANNKKRVRKKTIFSEKALENIRLANSKRRKTILTECKNCGKLQSGKFCSRECRYHDIEDKTTYKNKCRFTFGIKDYPDEFDFSLIEKFGWYSPTNRSGNVTGVSRDHKFSVYDGFKHKVDPHIISHPANCELMLHSKNISKNKKSSLTIEELIIRIENWEEKYNRGKTPTIIL